MRTMKDSGVEWMGDMPADWKLLPIKRCIVSHMSGAWGKEAQKNADDCICLRVADFDYERFIFKNTPIENLTKRNFQSSNIESLLLKKGDILLEKSGGGDKTPVGRTVIFDKNYPAVFSNFLERLRCENIINPSFFQYIFSTLYKSGFVQKYIKQTTGIQNLDFTAMFAKEKFPLPSLEEQQRIADYLDRQCAAIDASIEKEKESIRRLEEYRQSVITEAVTRGLDPTAPRKDSGMEWAEYIPTHWNITLARFAIKKIADIDHSMPKAIEAGFPYIMTKDLRPFASQINFSECKQISESDYLALSKKITPTIGDIIFARYASIGTVCYVDIKQAFLPSYSCVVIRPDSRILVGKFLYWFLQSDTFSHETTRIINTNTQGNIGIDSLYKTHIILPPIAEQQQIAAYLDEQCGAIDRLISQKETLIAKLTEYKKSLIYETVTGKREV